MFKNYFKTAIRSLLKNKATTIINILGLSIGICAALIIFLIVKHENSFDKWEPDNDEIYRIYTQFGTIGTNEGISGLAPKEISNKVPGIKTLAHFYSDALYAPSLEIPQSPNKIKNINLSENDRIVFADEQYFKIFPDIFMAGNVQSLNSLNHVVISKSYADKFFPKIAISNVIGKQLIFNDSINTIVTGVVADQKNQTDFDYNIFISLKTLMETNLIDGYVGNLIWTNINNSSQCFVRLNPGVSVENIDKELHKLYNANIKRERPSDPENFAKLQPLNDVHLNTQLNGDSAKKNLRNIALLAAILILLASINFINLSTAQSSLRAKEIGVRKTFGGSKKQIVFQFLSETFLVIIASAFLAFLLYPIMFHLFKDFLPKKMPFDSIFQPVCLLYIILLIFILTLLAGLYPAFIMSKYKPIQVLKSNTVYAGKSEKVWLRQSLIVFQFVIAQVFLIIVFVVGKQIHYVLNKDMGFKKEAIVTFSTPEWNVGKYGKINVLSQELRSVSGIGNVSINSASPAIDGWHSTRITYENKGVTNEFNDVHVRNVDDYYLRVFGLKILAGTNVKIDTSTNIPDVIINETLMKQIGFVTSKEAIGHYLRGGNTDSSRIVGVVNDFSVRSLESAIQPTVLFANDFGYANKIAIDFSSKNVEDWNKALKNVEAIFHSIYKDKVFDYQFYDKSIEFLYYSQLRLNTLLKWATGLSIFISCMGLIGLVMFLANQRTKEIGIRKVLGASIPQILGLLSKNLVGLILLAGAIAFPIAWYYSHSWLADFSYKTDLSWWIFPVCAFGMLLTAMIIVWTWSLKAAKSNPADILRTE